MSLDRVRLHESWKARLADVLQSPTMTQLRDFLRAERAAGKLIYPRNGDIFAALDRTPFEAVKIVILGQDPYHGPGQAHGLCFSVPPGIAVPPSLQNIYKELRDDLDIAPPKHGCLYEWAARGVLLLNTVLTVEAGRAGSHQKRGWEVYTDAVIGCLNAQREHLVFMLWGSPARRKAALLDRDRHLVLEAAHPSPLSAHHGFFGCRHFSRANAWLIERGIAPIDFRIAEAA